MRSKRPRGRPPEEDVLTRTEWAVLHAVQHGMTTREIAKRRSVSIDAVKFHVANILAKLDVPNRKALRHWFRAPKTSALHEEIQVRASARLGPIHQIARTVKDIKRAEDWYRDILGLQHLYTFGTLAFFDCGGVRLYLSQAESGEPAAESILYFRVESITQAHDELRARGVEFINAPHLIHRHTDGTEEWLAMFTDPEKRPLGLMSQVRPPS